MAGKVKKIGGKDIFSKGIESRNIISELFDGHLLRGATFDGSMRFYTKDMGDAAGLDSGHVAKIINRLRLTVPEMLITSTMEVIGEERPRYKGMSIVLISLEGIPHFFNEIDASRLLPDKQEKVGKLQKFMMNLAGDVVSGQTERETLDLLSREGIAGRIEPFGEYFQQQMLIVKALQETLHIDLNTSTCLALQKTEGKYGEDMSEYKALIPKLKLEEVPYLTPSDIAKKLGFKSPQEVNVRLQQRGLQEREKGRGRKWIPTDAGKAHALFEPYTKNGHAGYQLRWKESVISVLRQNQLAYW